MRKLVFGITAAAAVLTTAPAFAQLDVRAGEGGVSVRMGERGHWRDRHWDDDRRVIIRRKHGVFARDYDEDCRTIIVRRRLPDGSVVVRKMRRCD
jgi:hypothetical protein